MTLPSCSSHPVRWERVGPRFELEHSSGIFAAIWGTGADDLFVAGNPTLHFDGANWDGLDMPGAAVRGIDRDQVYVVTRGPSIRRYSAGGWGWVDISTWPPADDVFPFNGVAPFATGELYVSSPPGVLRSLDLGNTWIWRNGTFHGWHGAEMQCVTSLWAIDHTRLFVTGDRSVPGVDPRHGVWRSTDRGDQWSFVPFPDPTRPFPEQRLFKVWGTGGHLYAVGAAILGSRDGGDSWQILLDRPPALLRDVGGSRPDDLYAVGDRGTVLHSTDRGASWHLVDVGTDNDLLSVWSSNCNDVYIGGVRILLHGH